MAPRPDAAPEATPVKMDHDDLIRKRDAFVTSMQLLRNAAEECSRSGLDFFNMAATLTSNGAIPMPQMPNMAMQNMTMPYGYTRAMSIAPEDSSKKRKRREKKPKDPDAPKRPATAYLMFCQEGRASVRKDLGEDVPYASVMNELRNRWNEMPAEEKKTWLEAYAKEFAGFKEREKEYKATKATNEAGVEMPIIDGAVATVPVPKPTGGFTAVNHAEKVVESDDDEEEEEEEEEEAEPVEEPEEGEQERESSSSLSPPPPPPKPKATPKKRGPKAKTPTKAAAAETPTAEDKKKKPRAKKADKEKETEAGAAEPAVEAPAKKGRKKRKTQE